MRTLLPLFCYLLSGLLLISGCGGGGGGADLTPLPIAPVDVNTGSSENRQAFLDDSRTLYQQNPSDSVANFRMALVAGLEAPQRSAVLAAVDKYGNVSPSSVGILGSLILDGTGSLSPAAGVNRASSILRIAADTSVIRVEDIQNDIEAVIVPWLDEQIGYLRNAQSDSFNFTVDAAMMQLLVPDNTSFPADKVIVLDKGDLLFLEGALRMTRSWIHFLLAWNLDSVESTDSLTTDVSNMGKPRGTAGDGFAKGVAMLSTFKSDGSQALTRMMLGCDFMRLQGAVAVNQLAWATPEAADVLKVALADLKLLYDSTGAIDWSPARVFHADGAPVSVRVDWFGAWITQPEKVDLKDMLKTSNFAYDEGYDYTLAGLLPTATSAAEAQALVQSLGDLSDTVRYIETIFGSWLDEETVDMAMVRFVDQISSAYAAKNTTQLQSLFAAGFEGNAPDLSQVDFRVMGYELPSPAALSWAPYGWWGPTYPERISLNNRFYPLNDPGLSVRILHLQEKGTTDIWTSPTNSIGAYPPDSRNHIYLIKKVSGEWKLLAPYRRDEPMDGKLTVADLGIVTRSGPTVAGIRLPQHIGETVNLTYYGYPDESYNLFPEVYDLLGNNVEIWRGVWNREVVSGATVIEPNPLHGNMWRIKGPGTATIRVKYGEFSSADLILQVTANTPVNPSSGKGE